ncbi:hypothetical protein P3X46_012879 [Hevea brasiliensis]|uniref:Pentacotripeptide-repeat region of PRORP domain-containing protein n=1 Tax=Hevea brasiliensis TaxID=3981 RepID=A0ABQ9MEA7_HEVBR|nr:pentatricopeptide repeat-containing protein At4g39530 [Hevea brasiliensis]KAJ9177688.1 hypothetical protein P3X46_012879 [Hevea brasiliensis]
MRNHYPLTYHLKRYQNFHSKQAFNLFKLISPLIQVPNPCFSFPKPTRTLQLANLLRSLPQNNPISHYEQICAQIIVSGLESDAFLTNLLIALHAKSDFLCHARKLFDKMPEKNLISWSSMLSVYSKRGFNEEAWLLFLDFTRCCNKSPNVYILASVLRASMQLDGGCGPVGKLMHCFIFKLGFDQDVFLGTSLVDFYAKNGDIVEARMVFDALLEKSTITWTKIITGYVRSGRSEVALQLFNQMGENDIVLDRYVLSSVLSACSTLKFVEGGKQIHAYVLRRGIEMDVSVVNVLIDFYAKSSKVQTARKLFDQMVDRDVISWTTMIAGYMQNSFDGEAVMLFVEMTRLGGKPDGFACTSILTSCGSLEALMLGRQIHAYSIKANLEFDIFLKNGLIDMYAKCDSLNDARRVFDVMTNHNVVSYNALIEGYSRSEQLSDIMILFHEMRHRMIPPSLLTFVSLLGVSAALSSLELSKQIHALTFKFGVCLAIFAGSALIDAYSKCLRLVDARLVFDEMNEKDIVVWNAMFSGYTQQSENEEALKLYSELQVSELKPNDFTFATFITAASNLASLLLGQQFHNHIIKMGLDFDPFITNSLIHMYAKCGSFEDACKAFGSAIWRDVACWNSLILTYAHHGEAKEALQMFEGMMEEGIKPNYVTFVSLLSACSHAGLVEDGLRYFKSMPKFCGHPGIEHYSCVVSLLCRAGMLYEAKEFIEKMPIKPTAAMWRSLLSASRIAGNIELSKYAAEKAISVDPNDSGSYTLLSNMFASKGKWVDVKQVRKRMDLVGLVKESGHSWIQVNNEISLLDL